MTTATVYSNAAWYMNSIFHVDGTNSVDDYNAYSNIFTKYEVYGVDV